MDQDNAYKRLFSEPEIVGDLLKGFVSGPWVKNLDLSTLELVSPNFSSEELRERRSDRIWRVRLMENTAESEPIEPSWLYVYLLLEFQSRPDPFMALRIMVYVGLLYQDLVRQKLLVESVKGTRLPPVLPIVIYNGEEPWRAPVQLAELIAPVEGFEDHTPPFALHASGRNTFSTRSPAEPDEPRRSDRGAGAGWYGFRAATNHRAAHSPSRHARA